MRDKTLKLYVWEGVFCSYGCGMIVVLAHDIEEARRVILKTDEFAKYYPEDLAKQPKIIYLTKNTKSIAFTVHGGD